MKKKVTETIELMMMMMMMIYIYIYIYCNNKIMNIFYIKKNYTNDIPLILIIRYNIILILRFYQKFVFHI